MIRFLIMLILMLTWANFAADAKVIKVIQDYSRSPLLKKVPAVVQWNWSKEKKEHALDFSSIETVKDSGLAKNCLKLSISPDFPWENRPYYRFLSLGINLFPPEADAVVLRVKIIKGSMKIFLGGPTIYFGHSDVFTQPVELKDSSEWQTIEISLHNGLSRNNRRSGFGKTSPVIYYTRWIQEPLFIYVNKGSHGEMLISQVELISKGQGNPYFEFTAEEIVKLGNGVDFEDAVDQEKTFTVFILEQNQLKAGPEKLRKSWTPSTLKIIPDGMSGKNSLETVNDYSEEVSFFGIKVQSPKDANALVVKLKAENLHTYEDVSLDFAALVTADPEKFPWDNLKPPAEWRNNPKVNFTYFISRDSIKELSFGYYHARRQVKQKTWTTLVIPLADFICNYGQMDCEEKFKKQLPLSADSIMAFAITASWRHHRKPTKILIDEIYFARVPEAKARPSYPQKQP